MTRVKICGITNKTDALWAAQCGADALGFVFADSPRRVTPEQAGEITQGLGPYVACTGVFASNSVGEIQRALALSGCSVVQLHSAEEPDFVRMLIPHPVVKAFRVGDQFDFNTVEPYREASAILLDTYAAGRLGGTGERFDIGIAAKLVQDGWRVIVAGGLMPENVGEVVRAVRPYAVDVSSGVEITVGKKHPGKVADFVTAVRAADKEIAAG
jgi:phosphoribosylanthranilate isomerase